MGLFSKVKKGLKSAVSGIGKAVKKIGKSVINAGKKVVAKVGRVMNKLGPIGMLAIGFIAPYAVPWMAAQGGVIGAIGTGLQTAGAAITAPFKAVGAVAGKAIAGGAQALGTGLGNAGMQTLGDMVISAGTSLGEMLGGTGIANKTWGEAATGSFKNVAAKYTQAQVKWDQAFGTNFAGRTGSETFGGLGASAAEPGLGSGVSASMNTTAPVNTGLPTAFTSTNLDLPIGTTGLQSLDSTGTSLLGKASTASVASRAASATAKSVRQPTSTVVTTERAGTATDEWSGLFSGLDPYQNVAPAAVQVPDFMERFNLFSRNR